jgi:tungstate transport system substrate-binding protein
MGGNRRYLVVAAAATVSAFSRPFPPLTAQSSTVILATTTSTRDTGLLDSLLPLFERASGYSVKMVAVGSGQALAMGKRGDADVVLSHAPVEEQELFAAGYFTSRRPVMRNDFVLVGPRADPAGVSGGHDAAAALRRLVQASAAFVSRGDRSGTHQLELALWRGIAVDPPGRGTRYTETGQGMGQTLLIADHRNAYTLTDRATFLVWQERINLRILVQGDTVLRNRYHVMEVSGRTSPRVNVPGARALAAFFVSREARAVIAAFGQGRVGRPLFAVDSTP